MHVLHSGREIELYCTASWIVLQESFLHQEFVDIVKYCGSPTATQYGLIELIREDGTVQMMTVD